MRNHNHVEGDMTPEEQKKLMVPDEQNTLGEVLKAIDSTESDPARNISIQIDHSLQEAVRSALNSGQVADVTLKVKVKPGAERRVSFSATVKATLPRPPVSSVTLYADAEGFVHTSDPAQGRLNFAIARSKKEN
jgi:hypothetical protein